MFFDNGQMCILQVRAAQSAIELVGNLLEMEAAMRPVVFLPSWDPNLASRGLQGRAATGTEFSPHFDGPCPDKAFKAIWKQ